MDQKISPKNTRSNYESYIDYKKEIQDFETKIKSNQVFSPEETQLINNNPEVSSFEVITGLNQTMAKTFIPKPYFDNASSKDSPIYNSHLLESLASSINDLSSQKSGFSYYHNIMQEMLKHTKTLHKIALSTEMIRAKIIGNAR